ncbi:hypothetical protein HHI36_008180, partial [Cryptolaemus montrouzieri]
DIVRITDNLQEAGVMIKELNEEMVKVGLCMNKQETKIVTNLVLGGTITLDSDVIEDVSEYKYMEE